MLKLTVLCFIGVSNTEIISLNLFFAVLIFSTVSTKNHEATQKNA